MYSPDHETGPHPIRRHSLLVVVCVAAAVGLTCGWSAGTGLSATVPLVSTPAAAVAPSWAVNRRHALSGLAGAVAAVALPRQANAAYGSAAGVKTAAESAPAVFKRFYGAANPPATYGGVGGTTREFAKYGYEVNVATWEELTVGKVDKGIGGIDSQWEGPGKKRAFCVTITRAGEDNVGYVGGGNPDNIIKSVAGAEPDLQAALQTARVTYTETKRNGVDFIDFDVAGAANHYLVRVGVKEGRLFAFYVTAPEKVFQQDRDTLTRTFQSFEVY